MGLGGLGVLDSFSKGVLNVVGPLVNRIGSIAIKGIVPLQMLQSASGSQNRRKQTDRATPVGWEVIHGGYSRRTRKCVHSNVTSLDHDRFLHTQGQYSAHSLRRWVQEDLR